jgi:DNA-binding LacI/PurR family transcriptional regulator
MRVTIKSVAERAGVAVGTVSRVINGRKDVDPKLRSRVERAIQDLGYRPNARARALSRGSSPILSFLLSNRDFVHPFHSRVLQGVEQYCSQAGYFVLFTHFEYLPSTSAEALRLPRVLQTHGIADCMIVSGTNYEPFLRALDKLGIDYVLLGNNVISEQPLPEFDQVRFDEIAGAREAASYLVQLGHRDIWFIGDTSLPWFANRHSGYVESMCAAGLEPRAFTARLADDPFTEGLRAVEYLMESKAPITALFCASDDIAYGAWQALERGGLHVPSEVSLVGFDDQYGPLRSPRLTSVRVDACEIGRELAKMAIEKIRNGGTRVPQVVLPTTLQRRETCRPLMPIVQTSIARAS